ncbi:MAG: hypothetical protein K9K75_00295 [Deltaproteobacteria bacterium]|nr:hypothetical protein [Deltaproteobacteria bacterium]
MKNKHLLIMSFTILLTLCSGCVAERHISPTLSDSERVGLELKLPILIAVFDGRATKEPSDAASQLQADLKRIYGSSIEWYDYFKMIKPGRVAVRIRIVTLGSSFGNRLISTTAFSNAISSAQVSATGSWGSVVGSFSGQQSVLAGSISGEGWWNGAAWVDIELQDYRGDKPIKFTIPLAAEHREYNMWGYASGDKAALIAWQQVAVQITGVMDSIICTMRDQQN